MGHGFPPRFLENERHLLASSDTVRAKRCNRNLDGDQKTLSIGNIDTLPMGDLIAKDMVKQIYLMKEKKPAVLMSQAKRISQNETSPSATNTPNGL